MGHMVTIYMYIYIYIIWYLWRGAISRCTMGHMVTIYTRARTHTHKYMYIYVFVEGVDLALCNGAYGHGSGEGIHHICGGVYLALFDQFKKHYQTVNVPSTSNATYFTFRVDNSLNEYSIRRRCGSEKCRC